MVYPALVVDLGLTTLGLREIARGTPSLEVVRGIVGARLALAVGVGGYAAVGLGVTALVGVIESDSVDDTGLEQAMAALPSVEDCWRTAGSEGYVLKVRVADIPALEDTISALNRIRGVARTRTTVVLSTKWEGRHGRAESD